ncbi:cyclic nucleotide-binding domain-containing protein [Spirosoma sp. HMF4905]|uniref:Cyclic nucleotide-binding domain-containing protein n=1 Tax=Spirosoma arboris TaxID=2682092 RepID=A0A7K1SJ36_9BACT|nr:Crp/Fnr family transcriptional regulator [Spirosoma arboris]MVM33783.1 cyclic nucleotide-binding domain-containing protein [Spirosoma arboris]
MDTEPHTERQDATRFVPLFTYLRLFKNIPSADVDVIQQELSYRSLAEGDYLLKEGSIATNLFFICDGVVRIVTQNEQGRELTHYFLKENQLVTILDSFNRGVPARESIRAACPTQVIVLPKRSLLLLYDRFPYLKELIDKLTQQTLLYKIQIRNAYLGEDAMTRYQQFLIRQPEIALRVSLQSIASYLGITQQSLSRIRRNSF